MALEGEPLRPESVHTATGEETESRPSRRTRNDVAALNPSPDSVIRNRIDYIAIPKKWRAFVLDAKGRPGAECDTDHILALAKLRIR